MARKDEFKVGYEIMLNSKHGNIKTDPKAFWEIQKESGMSITDMMRNIGRLSKNKQKEPTDAERSEARLRILEEAK